MAIQLSIDRFEGEQNNIAVLVKRRLVSRSTSHETYCCPMVLSQVKSCRVSIDRDLAATEGTPAKKLKKLQDELSQRDPGGDLEL